MRAKIGVDMSKLNPEIRRACNVLDTVYLVVCDCDMRVTSTYDSVHKEGSKHYTNDAVDTGIDELDGTRDGVCTYICILLARVIVKIAKLILGRDFDIIVESDHIHMEYDPKCSS